MRFPQDFIERVRDANNLVEIISQHTELKRAGDRLMGRCPFPDHAEKTGSFSVTESKQLYHCFGCKKSGNIFTFLETFQGLNFPQAVEYLAKRANIEIPADIAKFQGKRDVRDQLFAVNKLAAQHYKDQLKSLPNAHPAIQYMVARGLTPEVVEKFRIGVSLDPWEGLVNFLNQKKIPLAQAESLGLLKRKKQGSGFFDLFRERIMFPILSPSDEILGFGGRTFTDQTPKYLNSPESPVFSKGRTLYGLHETARYIRSQDQVIIVEGYMDAIALYIAGIKNVVAILGTALTPDHAKLLKRYTNNVTLLLDGDNAGMNAAERSLPILLEGDLLVKGCFLPDKQDPDDFIKAKGAEALKAEIDRAPELYNLVLGRMLSNYRGSSSEKVQLVEQLYPILKVMHNAQLRELYLEETAQRLDVDLQWLTRSFQAVSKRERAATAAAQAANAQMAAHSANAGNVTSAQAAKATVVPTSKVSTGADSPRTDDVSPRENDQEAMDELTEVKRELIKVKGAPRDEAFVLSLALTDESLLLQVSESGVEKMLSHSGIREALNVALDKYRQQPKGFDKLAASLASQTDDPSVITASFEALTRSTAKQDGSKQDNGTENSAESASSGSVAEDGSRLMASYVLAIKKRFYDRQLKAMANQMRNQSSAEQHPQMLEQFMNIQKARHALDKE